MANENTFEIIFHIHGNGPGSDLADQLEVGDSLKITVPGGNVEVPTALGFEAVTVLKIAGHPGQQAISYLESIGEKDVVLNSIFYLTGNVASVQEFRKALKRIGVSAKNILFQGYWAEGSVGL